MKNDETGPACDAHPSRPSLNAEPLPFGLSPWPLDTVLERLADAADHLRGDHNCDALGHEGVLYAAQAAREHIKILRAAPAPSSGSRDDGIERLLTVYADACADEAWISNYYSGNPKLVAARSALLRAFAESEERAKKAEKEAVLYKGSHESCVIAHTTVCKERERLWGLLCDTAEALGKTAPEAAPYVAGWAKEMRARAESAEAAGSALREALTKIAKGSSSVRGGGGHFCDWCHGAAAEDFADLHPKNCPRTIARAALASPDHAGAADHGETPR